MAEQSSFDVILVGGGMVGATLALALARAGMQVAVVEQHAPAPFEAASAPDLRVSALSEASQRILRHLGVWPQIAAMRQCPYRQMAVWERLQWPGQADASLSRFNRTLFDAEQAGLEQLGTIVENRLVQLALWQAFAEVDTLQLFCPAQIRSLSWDKDHNAEVALADGRQLAAPLLIGADGARSQVRDAAGLGLETAPYPQHALVATVAIAGGQQDITWQAFTPTGPEAFLPLADCAGKSWASLVWYHRPEEVERLMALDDAAFLAALEQRFPFELPAILALHERGSFPLVRRHAAHYTAPGVALVGDAAHTIHPLAGQGVNLGFKDAAWLAEILVDAWRAGERWGAADVLKRYEARRMPENRRMQRLMDLFCYSFGNDLLPLKILRNIGLGVAGQLTAVHRPVLSYALGLAGPQPRLVMGLPL